VLREMAALTDGATRVLPRCELLTVLPALAAVLQDEAAGGHGRPRKPQVVPTQVKVLMRTQDEHGSWVRAVASGALRQHDGSVAWPILSRARIFDGSQDPSVVEPKMLEILVSILTRFPDYFNTVVKAVQHGGMLDTLFATEWLAVREQLQDAFMFVCVKGHFGEDLWTGARDGFQGIAARLRAPFAFPPSHESLMSAWVATSPLRSNVQYFDTPPPAACWVPPVSELSKWTLHVVDQRDGAKNVKADHKDAGHYLSTSQVSRDSRPDPEVKNVVRPDAYVDLAQTEITVISESLEISLSDTCKYYVVCIVKGSVEVGLVLLGQTGWQTLALEDKALDVDNFDPSEHSLSIKPLLELAWEKEYSTIVVSLPCSDSRCKIVPTPSAARGWTTGTTGTSRLARCGSTSSCGRWSC
jgi:hypothetical protein